MTGQGFNERLAEIGGRSLDGRPRLRVVFGADERGFPNADSEELKYPSPDDPEAGWAVWILEELAKPEFFGSPEEWERNRWSLDDAGRRVEVMAPYPHGGAYVMVQPLVTPDGRQFPLGSQALDYVSWLVRTSHGRPQSGQTEQRQIEERLRQVREWKEEERRKRAEAALAEVHEGVMRRQEETKAAESRAWSRMPSRGDKLLRRLKQAAKGAQTK